MRKNTGKYLVYGCEVINMAKDLDMEYIQQTVERVNKSLEDTRCSVTMEDIIALNDKFNAWDDMREHMQGGKNPVQKKRPVQAGRKVQPPELIIYPNVGVNELRLGMTHNKVQEILGTPESVSKPFGGVPAQEDYCWNGYPNWIFRLTFREDQLSEIMICLDETREQKIPVMLCGVDLSIGHPEDIVPKLLTFSDCYYDTYPKSQEIYEKYRVTSREQSLHYLFDGLGVYFTRFTDFHPNYLGTDYYDGWNPEAIADEKLHWNMETVTMLSKLEIDRLRADFNSRDTKSN